MFKSFHSTGFDVTDGFLLNPLSPYAHFSHIDADSSVGNGISLPAQEDSDLRCPVTLVTFVINDLYFFFHFFFT